MDYGGTVGTFATGAMDGKSAPYATGTLLSLPLAHFSNDVKMKILEPLLFLRIPSFHSVCIDSKKVYRLKYAYFKLDKMTFFTSTSETLFQQTLLMFREHTAFGPSGPMRSSAVTSAVHGVNF